MIITITDIRQAGHCTRGAKNWFAEHELDFRDFLKNGIDAETFLATGCGMARQVVERKIARDLIGVDLTGIVITARDAQAAGKCVDGSRNFAGVQNFDYRDFVQNGIPAQVLWDTGDFEARMVVRHKVAANG